MAAGGGPPFGAGHLVLSGRRLPPIGLARHLAGGSGLLIDSVDLAFHPDELARLDESGVGLATIDRELASWPALASLMMQGRADLVTDFLGETVLHEADPVVGRALAAVAVVGGCPSELLRIVAGSVVGDGASATTDPALTDVVRQLTRLLLVRARGDGCWPHPVWAEATASLLTPEEHNRVIVAAARGQVAAGMITVAGHLAIRTGNHQALAEVVRGALATLPPNASMADLTSWAASGLLPADSVERTWLQAVVDLQLGDLNGTVQHRLEASRLAFERSGDIAGETSVIVSLGNMARARSDVVELARLLARADVLATQGNATARGLAALGHAVGKQLSNDPEAALRALDEVPTGALVGEWATQVMMIRGTNLLLTGRAPAAIRALDGATGEGTDASRAVAHDLLAAARWYAGDQVGALRDAEAAETLALRSGTPTSLQLARASRACLLAATNQTELTTRLLEQLRHGNFGAGSEEADALAHVAEVLLLIEAGDLSGAWSTLKDTEVPSRTVRSAVWKAAL